MDWKELVKSVAPVLGTALGGPFGGMASRWLAGRLLGDENAGESALEAAISTASPDTFVRLRELDNEFRLEMKRIGLEEKQLEAGDRADARSLAKVNMTPHMVISAIYVLAFALVLYVVFSGELTMTQMQERVMMYLLGILSAGLLQIMNFWFGSSSGSKEKTAKLAIG